MILKRLLLFLKHEYLVRRRPIEFARTIGARLGENGRLLGLARKTFGSEPYLVQLGRHVTLTGNVRFVTHDGGVWVFRDREPEIEVVDPIIVGDNVFVGLDRIISPEVRIGANCVIGAGSVVNRDIPANSVAARCPATVISSIDEYGEKTRARTLYCRTLFKQDKRTFLEEKIADRFIDAH